MSATHRLCNVLSFVRRWSGEADCLRGCAAIDGTIDETLNRAKVSVLLESAASNFTYSVLSPECVVLWKHIWLLTHLVQNVLLCLLLFASSFHLAVSYFDCSTHILR